ncbi:MAG: hypothetical protein WCT14_07175 [Treponemataceae bacterium]
MTEDNAAIVIDSERAANVLSESAPQVFADMTFMDAVPVSVSWGPKADTVPAAQGAAQRVHIAIDMLKPLSCRLELEFPRSLGDRINETLYADTAELVDAGDDSTLEMLNVMAGSFLSTYFGSGTSFKLELPFFIFGASEVSGPAIARIELEADGIPATLTLRSIRYRY